jgi:glycosyltransferase involved in cell wall biosynthesis
VLSDITIIIPTFHRRGYLRVCLDGIQANLPECKVVVVSDDDITPENQWYNWVTWYSLPYDSGLTAKRNQAASTTSTKYALMGCDDFDFSTPEVRQGIIEFAMVLNSNKYVDVIAGRVSNRPYEVSQIEYVPGEHIREHALDLRTELPFALKPLPIWRIDLAANYFLARAEVLREVPWDETVRPIGGEHADWFLDLKDAGKTVGFLPFVNINTQEFSYEKQDPRYQQFRQRALTTGHALMKKKRNIKQYIDFNGGIS